jgi:uncharacterized membrane protein YcaP (DUF421 family)
VLGMDWAAVLAPRTPLLEIVVRGSLVYLAVFALLRVVLRREAGTVGITDLLVLVLIADAAQNALGADYRSVGDGVLLVATIVLTAYGVDWLGYRFPLVKRLVHPPALPLIQDGRVLRRNLRHELITEDELLGHLRLHGIDDVGQVKVAHMESDGRISVVKRDGATADDSPERRA